MLKQRQIVPDTGEMLAEVDAATVEGESVNCTFSGEAPECQPPVDPSSMFHKHADIIEAAVHFIEADPETFQEALAAYDRDDWIAAIERERGSLRDTGTFIEVDPPDDRGLLGGKWVFTRKRGPDGEVVKHKARWVAKGYGQVQGLDYTDTFSPTLHKASMRMLFAQAASQDWEIHQFDVETAFLKGTLKEEIYMKPPTGLTHTPGKVWKLVKSLYGLKQASKVWRMT